MIRIRPAASMVLLACFGALLGLAACGDGVRSDPHRAGGTGGVEPSATGAVPVEGGSAGDGGASGASMGGASGGRAGAPPRGGFGGRGGAVAGSPGGGAGGADLGGTAGIAGAGGGAGAAGAAGAAGSSGQLPQRLFCELSGATAREVCRFSGTWFELLNEVPSAGFDHLIIEDLVLPAFVVARIDARILEVQRIRFEGDPCLERAAGAPEVHLIATERVVVDGRVELAGPPGIEGGASASCNYDGRDGGKLTVGAPEVVVNGVVDVSGGQAAWTYLPQPFGGRGGDGGSVSIEATVLDLSATAELLALPGAVPDRSVFAPSHDILFEGAAGDSGTVLLAAPTILDATPAAPTERGIAGDAVVSRTVDLATDEFESWWFEALAGESVTLQLESSTPGVDLDLYLLAGDGSILASGLGPTSNEQIVHVLADSGTYHVAPFAAVGGTEIEYQLGFVHGP